MNAKELSLSKLNAGTKTIGMYIYGISIGMDFRDVAKLLMSDTGAVINLLMEDNVFTSLEGYNKIDKVFDYFNSCPSKFLDKFNANGVSPLAHFLKVFLQYINLPKDRYNNPLPFKQALAVFAKSNIVLSDKLNEIEKLRGTFTNFDNIELYNQLIDFIEDYVIQLHTVDPKVLGDIKTLAEGAEEMRKLGAILSLNQGVKTDTEGLLRLVNLIERAIYDITEDEADLIDLHQFVNDADYRNSAIARYEEVKHSFNILDVVSTIPHFFGYLQILATTLKGVENSFKFRSAKNLSLPISKLLNFKEEKKIIKGIYNYVGDYMRKTWMIEKGITIIVPKGNKAFDKNGNVYELTQDTPIRLGTDWGDATFRMFMENLIIPDLKNGIIKPGVNFSFISDNKFILDLSNDLLTITTSKNPSIIYTLPINMLPRVDLERALLNNYKSEFNKLAQFGYLYELSSYGSNGNEIKSMSEPLSLIDLFTYYAMIANNWKLNEKSLVPILEDFLSTGIIKEFHDFEALLDKSGESLEVPFTEILPYVAPYQNPRNGYVNYIFYRNPSTRKMLIMKKMSRDMLAEEDDYYENASKIGKYEFIGVANTNYFTTGRISELDNPKVEKLTYINKNTLLYLNLLDKSGVSDDILEQICLTFISAYNRLPYLDEILGSDSELYIRKLFGIKGNNVNIQELCEALGVDNILRALQKLNDDYRDLEIKLTPISEAAIIEITHRPVKTKVEELTVRPNQNSYIIFNDFVAKLSELYGIPIHPITNAELNSENWKGLITDAMSTNAFIYNGEIYLNLDNCSVDAPVHEIMHLLIGSLRFKAPNVYLELVNSVSNMANYTQLSTKYPGRSRNDIFEEYFVTEVSKFMTGINSVIDDLNYNLQYEILYNVRRLLDIMLMGQTTVKSVDNIFNISLNELAGKVNSEVFNRERAVEDSALHRKLNNIKSQLIESKELEETCK